MAVAVSSTVLGTGLVPAVLGHAAVLVHRNKVQGPVQAAANLGNVHVKRELVAQQREHLVRGFIFHEIQPATDVLAVRAVGHELDAQLVAARGDAVGASVVGTIDAALLRTCLARGADGRVPLVAGVAVGGAVEDVRPAPVGVDGDGALHG